ncbi:MAG: alpha/beta fold hydrolase [Polyangiaceae bacterium]
MVLTRTSQLSSRPKRVVSALALFVASIGACTRPALPPRQPAQQAAPSATVSAEAVVTGKERSGSLITYQRGAELGRERYRDDGATLRDEVSFEGHSRRIVLDRARRSAEVELEGGTTRADLDDSTIALETGSWASYVVAADRFAPQQPLTPVTVLLPSEQLNLRGAIEVRARAGGGRTIRVLQQGLEARVEVNAEGLIERAVIPEQGLEALPEGAKPPVPAPRETPAEVTETALEILREGVPLRGTLWLPRNRSERVPVVLIAPGSGPTDRDGNNHSGLRTDMYRMLAIELAKHGVGSLRFDKRGVGQSGRNFDPATMTIDDLVQDTAAWLDQLRQAASIGSITLMGHSEGGEVALLVAQRHSIDGLILIATAGRTHRVVLREQLSRRLSQEQLTRFDHIADEIAAGRRVSDVPPEMWSVLRPTVQTFVRSDLDLDPLPLMSRVRAPTTVIQGDADVQIRPKDARLLHGAKRDSKLFIVPGMNHVLKQEFAVWLAQDSYMDAQRPLASGLVDAVLAGVVGR